MSFPKLSGKRFRKLRKRWRRASRETLSSQQGEKVPGTTPVLSHSDRYGNEIGSSGDTTSLSIPTDVSESNDDVIFSLDRVLSDAADDPNHPEEVTLVFKLKKQMEG